jgi:branched-subunit amino acid transport protein
MGLSSPEIFAALFGVAVVVFVTRNAFVFLPRHWQPRGVLERALRHVPIAALAALTIPQALAVLRSASPDLSLVLLDARLPASIVTVAVACWRRSALAGMLAGGAVFIVLLTVGPTLLPQVLSLGGGRGH